MRVVNTWDNNSCPHKASTTPNLPIPRAAFFSSTVSSNLLARSRAFSNATNASAGLCSRSNRFPDFKRFISFSFPWSTGSATATPLRPAGGAYIKLGAYDSTRACLLRFKLICRSWVFMFSISFLLCRAITPAFRDPCKIQQKLEKPGDSPISRLESTYHVDCIINRSRCTCWMKISLWNDRILYNTKRYILPTARNSTQW